MEALTHAIHTTPIIDQHAHNLLLPSEIKSRPLLSITSEASDSALQHTPSTLAHLRAVKQLAEVLECEPKWEVVQKSIEEKRKAPNDAWAKRCFQGIETVLIDDGLDEGTVYAYDWHDGLTRSKCKRVVRIENIAEDLMTELLKRSSDVDLNDVTRRFVSAIEEAILDDEVVGFKSIIAYNSGLAIETPLVRHDLSRYEKAFEDLTLQYQLGPEEDLELGDATLGSYFVHLVAQAIKRNGGNSDRLRKPFQFHTGLGDNDEDLRLSNPLLMRPFIEEYPEVPIVLLHAGYPFTRGSGYLASVYDNVYLDVGEVFPMISQDGQETVIREALDLCPTEKIMWSTDGHWFPESYLLAVLQIREALEKVLKQNVNRKSLTVPEAINVVEDIFFNTSNRLYGLNLTLSPLLSWPALLKNSKKADNLALFTTFCEENPSMKYLRVQWLDYTSTQRLRILPIKEALKLFTKGSSLTVFGGCLGLLQNDHLIPGHSPLGAKNLSPCFESLRLTARPGHATVQAEFLDSNAEQEVAYCPRTVLRKVVEKAKVHGLEFSVGFEIEVAFVAYSIENGKAKFNNQPVSQGHAYCSSRALQTEETMTLLEEIVEALMNSGIEVQQFHPEACPGQYEFVTGPLPPLLAVDTLLASREIISTLAAKHNLRATLIPKPVPSGIGTGAHVHLSFTPENRYENFYAGILKHLRAIIAFTQPNIASYERMGDGSWSGGTWVAWGTQNRETPLRKIDRSHWEIKCVDGFANMYLTLAAILGLGLHSWIEREPMEIRDCESEPAGLSEEKRRAMGIRRNMPFRFEDAMKELEEDELMKEVLGQECVDTYLAVKKVENDLLKGMDGEERRNWLIERY
ncbi:MAG: hypothetical protein M1812_003243 [Candelaria pacifica]|nr:MAG: hypothetical protein M1812_003243 [Candelaria pacifica]